MKRKYISPIHERVNVAERLVLTKDGIKQLLQFVPANERVDALLKIEQNIGLQGHSSAGFEAQHDLIKRLKV